MSFKSNNRKSDRIISCPTCGNVVDTGQSPAVPFCSARCKQVDLGRWLDEEIGMPVDPERDSEFGPDGDDWDVLDSLN